MDDRKDRRLPFRKMSFSAVVKEESGNPIPIFMEQNGKFRLLEENLKKILLRDDVKDKPVMILSIAGATREGKSFILNFIIRYLRSSMNENWLGDQTAPLGGFSWKGGLDRNTMGILLWSEPFQIDTANGKISLLLMDTQGLFDDETNMNDIKTIFCMSFLLSSFQVYNVMKMIKDDMMQCFTTFLEYAKMAQSSEKHQCLVQRLMFLVRDWPDEVTHMYGREGGKEYIDKYLNSPNASRTNLKNSAEKLICFLLPSPGKKVRETRRDREPFHGALAEIDPKFVEKLPELMQTFFSPENVVPKSVNGQLLTGKDLMVYARKLDEIFSGDELPGAEDVTTIIKSSFYAALKEEFLTKFREMMDQLVEVGGMTENEFLVKSKKAVEQQLHEYAARPKYGGDDDVRGQNEIKKLLQREHEFYIQKQRIEREILRKKCCLLADEKCSFYEKQLEKKFEGICCKSKTLTEAVNVATRNAQDALPDLVRNSAFDQLFRSRILKGMERVANNLEKQNDAMLRDMEATCKKISLRCERFIEDEMEKMLQQKVWAAHDIPRCKRDLKTATSNRWSVLSKKVNGPTEVLDKHKGSLESKADVLISSFEEKNLLNKLELDRKATQESRTMLEEYESLMLEMIGRVAHVRQDMEAFHTTCCMKAKKSERFQHLSPSLKGETTQLFIVKVEGEYERLMEKNSKNAEMEKQLCYSAKSNCIKEAERLIHESIERRFLDDIALRDCVKQIKRRILLKFDSDCSTTIAHVQNDPRRELQQYLEKELPKIAQERNEKNEMLMEKDVEAVIHLMKTECGLLFEGMLGMQHCHHPRSEMFDNMVRNKLHELVDKNCSSETAKERCRGQMEQILDDEREKWNERRLEAEQQRKERAVKMKLECLRTYRRKMEKVMKCKFESYLIGRIWIEIIHCAVVLEISAVLGWHHGTNEDSMKKEIFHEIGLAKKELLKRASMTKENIERAKVKLRNFYETMMENKLCGSCCSESDLRKYELEAIDSVNDMRKDMNVEFGMSTSLLLSTEMGRVRARNVLENENFKRRCRLSALDVIEEYRELPAGMREKYSRDSAARNDYIDKRQKSFERSLKGNSDTVEQYSAHIKNALDQLSCERHEEFPSRVPSHNNGAHPLLEVLEGLHGST